MELHVTELERSVNPRSENYFQTLAYRDATCSFHFLNFSLFMVIQLCQRCSPDFDLLNQFLYSNQFHRQELGGTT